MKAATSKRTASQAYAENVSRADALLQAIQANLIARGDCRKKNWGHVGDMAYVVEKLQEVADYLNNEG